MFCFHRESQYCDDECYPTTTSDDQIDTEMKVVNTFLQWRHNTVNNKIQAAADKLQKDYQKLKATENPDPERLKKYEEIISHPNFGCLYLQRDVEQGVHLLDGGLYPTPIDATQHDVTLRRQEMLKTLQQAIKTLPPISSFRNIQPWVIFWTLHAIDLLDLTPVPAYKSLHDIHPTSTPTATSPPQTTSPFWTKEFGLEFLSFMSHFQSRDGGFTGTPGFDGHVLISYACVASMVTVAARCGVMSELYNFIDIPALRKFYLSMKITDPNHEDFGSFMLASDGEIDTRVVYCLLAACDMLGMLPDPEITDGLVSWLQRCQQHDGGFGAQPSCPEPHGGYTSIALASFIILEACHFIPNLDLLEKWSVTLQFQQEGGFSGRTQKLVDSCYSYWSAAVVPLIHIARQQVNQWKMLVFYSNKNKKATQTTTNDTTEHNQQQPPHADMMTQTEQEENKQLGIITIDRYPSSALSLLSQTHIHSQYPTDYQPNSTTNNTLLDINPTTIPTSLLFAVSSLVPPKDLGWVFDQHALQEYLLIACQGAHVFTDKPGKPGDLYHTCYGLSGLALAQVNVAYGKSHYTAFLKDYAAVMHQSHCHDDKRTDKDRFKQENVENSTNIVKIDDSQHAPAYNRYVLDKMSAYKQITKEFTPFSNLGKSFGSNSTLLSVNNIIYNISQQCYQALGDFKLDLQQRKKKQEEEQQEQKEQQQNQQDAENAAQ